MGVPANISQNCHAVIFYSLLTIWEFKESDITLDHWRSKAFQKQESRLYLNDDLTRSRSQLLYECCQAKKKQLISDCWSYDGSIIVKTLTKKFPQSKPQPILIRSVCYQINMLRTLLTSLTMFGLHLHVPLFLYVSIYMYTKSVTYTYNHFSKHGCNIT